jgi:hypothetical protein
MVRGLLAPLSPREVHELLHLLHGRAFELGPIALKRFVMLGFVEERPDGLVLTNLGRPLGSRAATSAVGLGCTALLQPLPAILGEAQRMQAAGNQ